MQILCDTCEGTGRVRPHPYDQTTMRCPRECHDGYWPARAADLDGLDGVHKATAAYGALFLWHGVLCLETETGLLVVNLQPEDVEVRP